MAILTPAPFNYQQKIRSELTEGLQLSYADIMPTIIHMRLTTQSAPGPNPEDPRAGAVAPPLQYDTYRIPGDYNFLVTEIHAHLAMTTLSEENTTGAATTGLVAKGTVKDRTIAKALNAFVSLVNADRNDLTFVEGDIYNSSSGGSVYSRLCLASLMPLCGGAPIKLVDQNYVAPLIVPANERLRMGLTVTDAGAALGQTEYGLALIGALVRMRVG